jgi:hypothetical protein
MKMGMGIHYVMQGVDDLMWRFWDLGRKISRKHRVWFVELTQREPNIPRNPNTTRLFSGLSPWEDERENEPKCKKGHVLVNEYFGR